MSQHEIIYALEHEAAALRERVAALEAKLQEAGRYVYSERLLAEIDALLTPAEDATP